MHLGADESAEAGRLMPVRMLNEFTYCPRLFYLEWVQGEFVDNEFTVEGRFAHRRVDARAGAMPAPADESPFEVRSVALSSAQLGLSAKIDLVEGENGAVSPVDYKRGKPPPNGLGAHEPERVQLCAYGLLLREHGYNCERGVLYFTEAKTRVEVEFELVRRLVPARDDAQPLYVQEQGARVGLDGEVLEVRSRDRGLIGKARLFELSQLVLLGNVQVSAQAIRELCGRGMSWDSISPHARGDRRRIRSMRSCRLPIHC